VRQYPLLRTDQLLAQNVPQRVLRWGLVNETGVVMHARTRTIALQDGLGLPLEMGDQITNSCVRGHDSSSKLQRVEAWGLMQPFALCA
jgi:hypothetical protein